MWMTPTVQAALSQQHWQKPALYIVATPIGNRMDITLRALYCLQMVDVIAAEDTRQSKILLQQWGIQTPLVAVHQHNEHQATQQLIERLQQGQSIALITDAGTPAVSDPGGKVACLVRQAGFPVIPVPGACAVITALMASGFCDDENPAFTFAGFIPSKGRFKWLQQWQSITHTLIFYETPHRIQEAAKDLQQVFAGREMMVARELTKRFEETAVFPVDQLPQWLSADSHRQQGEFVLLIGPAPQSDRNEQQAQQWLQALLKEGMAVNQASKLVAQMTGIRKKELYEYGLQYAKEDS